MSKAWATGTSVTETLPLLIGQVAGATGDAVLSVPSSIFISDSGHIFLGSDAERQHRASLSPHRLRFDNIKRLLSEEQVGSDLYSIPLLPGIDPTDSGLSRGDLLVLYLAWLTDLAERALSKALDGSSLTVDGGMAALRAVTRRFAIPCFESADDDQARGLERAAWAKKVMSDAIVRAQLLADSLTNEWKNLDTKRVAKLMADLRQIDVVPLERLLTEVSTVREPIAAGASRFDSSIEIDEEPAKFPRRRFLLVVDAGAGTTDIALFQAITPRGKTDVRYALIKNSVRMNRIAGNAIDAVFRVSALASCGIDPNTGYPRSKDDFDYIQSDLGSQLRALKQVLFEHGRVDVELKPNAKGEVTLDKFSEEPSFKKFGADLMQARRSVLDSAFSTADLESLKDHGPYTINVLLTGGSSKLPIINALSEGGESIHGVSFRFKRVEALPQWIDTLPRESAGLVSNVYPQCAVAIGGSAAELPVEISDLNAPLISPLSGERVVERYRTQEI